MLYAAETWAMTADTLNRLRRNDRAMIPWICNVKAKDEVSSDSLLTKLGIQDLDVVLRTSIMRWFGHHLNSLVLPSHDSNLLALSCLIFQSAVRSPENPDIFLENGPFTAS